MRTKAKNLAAKVVLGVSLTMPLVGLGLDCFIEKNWEEKAKQRELTKEELKEREESRNVGLYTGIGLSLITSVFGLSMIYSPEYTPKYKYNPAEMSDEEWAIADSHQPKR